MKSSLKCVDCGSVHLIRSGWYKDYQRYKCKCCGYRFTDVSKRRNSKYFITKAVQLWLDGLSINAISAILGIDRNHLANWLSPYTENLQPIRLSTKKDLLTVNRFNEIYLAKSKGKYSTGLLIHGRASANFVVSRLSNLS